MIHEVKFRRKKILLGILFFALFIAISIAFILTPETFVRNIFSTPDKIQFIGLMTLIYASISLYSLIIILTRKFAIRITTDYIIENSKYESIGEIKWENISKIQRLKNNNIELVLNKTILKSNRTNLLKIFLRFMNNWNHQTSVLISSALLDSNREDLYKLISLAHKTKTLN